MKSKAPSTIEVDKISIPKGLVNIRRGRMFEYDGKWHLTTDRGQPLAEFDSDQKLEEWWKKFNELRRRSEAPLLRCECPPPSWARLVERPIKKITPVEKQTLTAGSILGVDPPPWRITHARKFAHKGGWYICSGGDVAARFWSESKLDQWWQLYLLSRGISKRTVLITTAPSIEHRNALIDAIIEFDKKHNQKGIPRKPTKKKRKRSSCGDGGAWLTQTGQGGNRYFTRGWTRHA